MFAPPGSGSPARGAKQRGDERGPRDDDEKRRAEEQEAGGHGDRRHARVDDDGLPCADGLHRDERGQERDGEQVGDPRRVEPSE